MTNSIAAEELKALKIQIDELLAMKFIEEESILRCINAAQERFYQCVMTQINTILNHPEIGSQESLAKTQVVSTLLNRMWKEFHHPTLKYFQNQFSYFQKTRKQPQNNTRTGRKPKLVNPVGARKVFDKFVKIVSSAHSFYFSMVKELISACYLSSKIPTRKILQTLKMTLDHVNNRVVPVECVIPIATAIHRCTLYIGDLSRYRALIAKKYLPSDSISKEDNNNYSKSIELYKLALLILPSNGEPFNHIALVDNLKDDKFNVIYNFMRSSSTRYYCEAGLANLFSTLLKFNGTHPILEEFEKLYNENRATLTKSDKFTLIKMEFICLVNYHLFPKKWSQGPGKLLGGYEIAAIEHEFYSYLKELDYHKQINNDFIFKQMVILIGGYGLLCNVQNENLTDSKEQYLQFVFREISIILYMTLKCWNKADLNLNIVLLPILRLILCWFTNNSEVFQSAMRCEVVMTRFVAVFNMGTEYFEVEGYDKYDLSFNGKINLPADPMTSFLDSPPQRLRLFKEDVLLREFSPIGYHMQDFDDMRNLFTVESEESCLAQIGEFYDKEQKAFKTEESYLRLVAIVTSWRHLTQKYDIGIPSGKVSHRFNIPQELIDRHLSGLASCEEDQNDAAKYTRMVSVIVDDENEDDMSSSKDTLSLRSESTVDTQPFSTVWSERPAIKSPFASSTPIVFGSSDFPVASQSYQLDYNFSAFSARSPQQRSVFSAFKQPLDVGTSTSWSHQNQLNGTEGTNFQKSVLSQYGHAFESPFYSERPANGSEANHHAF